jgi:hypothetical protein
MSVLKRTWKTKIGELLWAWIADYVDQDGHRHRAMFKLK